MAIPAFGFSFGDFVAGIQLVKDLITALNDTVGAKVQYRRLISELLGLQRALTEVRYLQVEDSMASQKIALEQAAFQCQESIEGFLKRNVKFKASLAVETTSSKWSWRANLHKIQWALCKENDVDKLRAEITGHTLTINTLLATMHLSTTRLQAETARNDQLEHRRLTDESQSLVKRNHDLLTTQAELIPSISRGVVSCSTRDQAEELQSIMLKVLNTNIKIYEMVLDMQKLQFQLPAQVDRQQPVCFEDAHGRIAPFHVEFINSFEAFQAVMEVRFRHVPGLKKVQNIQYAIHESTSKRKIDLTAPWESVFLPGRKVNMSMVFRRPQTSMSSCPACLTENEIEDSKEGSEIQCSNEDCKQWFRRVIEIQEPKFQLGKRLPNPTPESSRKRSKQAIVEGARYDEDQVAEDDGESEDEIQQFQRVQVVHNNTVPITPPLPVPFDSEVATQRQQQSSYWSVPEQTDFPALLAHFGTDWHGIAKWMTSKTHIMVYATVFQQWLVVPQDTNKSRRVASIQTQVKNYYQRQVDSGKMKEWEDIARDADEKKSRGEETGPLPTPTIPPKRYYDKQFQMQPQYTSRDGYVPLANNNMGFGSIVPVRSLEDFYSSSQYYQDDLTAFDDPWIGKGAATWQERLEEKCREAQIYPPVFQIMSDKRGGRVAWSSTVTVQGQNVAARFWYDGQHVCNAKEDAAEVALNKMQHLIGSNPGSPHQSRSGW